MENIHIRFNSSNDDFDLIRVTLQEVVGQTAVEQLNSQNETREKCENEKTCENKENQHENQDEGGQKRR